MVILITAIIEIFIPASVSSNLYSALARRGGGGKNAFSRIFSGNGAYFVQFGKVHSFVKTKLF